MLNIFKSISSTCKFSKHLFLFDQMLDYKIGICCFSLKHAAVRSKSKDWLAREHKGKPSGNLVEIEG
jgi:hypothetical protein